MVSVTEIKRLYSILLSNTHILIHNITSLPADFFFLTLKLMAVGRKNGLRLTDQKKKKKMGMSRTEGRKPARTKWNRWGESSSWENLWNSVCSGEEGETREKWGWDWGDGIGGRKKEDQRKRKANSLYVKQKISEIYQSSVGEMWLVKPWQMSIWWKMIF